MNKHKNIALRTAVSFSLLICILLGTFFAIHIGAAGENDYFPTLYCNDEIWYKYDMYPLQKSGQSYYMPMSLLEKFDGIEFSSNEKYGTILITYKNGKYISFNTEINYAITDSLTDFYLMTYLYGGERYIPVETVCSSLGLSFEFYTYQEEKTALRVSDGNEKKEFGSLIEAYYQDDNPIIVDTYIDTTYETTEPKPYTKTVYIIIENVLNDYVDGILQTLKQHKSKATFFTTNGALQNDSEHIVKIISTDNAVGLSFNSDGYEADCVNSLKMQNEKLIGLIKYKVRFALISGSGEEYESALASAKNAGYIIWNYDIDMTIHQSNEKAEKTALFEAATANADVLVLHFDGNAYCNEILSDVLDFFDKKPEYNIKKITDAVRPQ